MWMKLNSYHLHIWEEFFSPFEAVKLFLYFAYYSTVEIYLGRKILTVFPIQSGFKQGADSPLEYNFALKYC